MNAALARSALVLSLAVNAAFAAYFAFRPNPPPIPPTAQSTAPKAAHSDSTSPEISPHPTAGSANLWQALDAGDLRTLIARLRAAGFSPAAVRAVANTKLARPYTARLKALRQGATDAPYWRPSPISPSRSADYYEQRAQVYREQGQAWRDLVTVENLGSPENASTYQRRRFGDLPQAAIDAIERVEKDYGDLTGEVRTTARGIFLPEDRSTLDLLESEKRRDLERILTPEQHADYELRTSPLTSRLSRTLTLMDATEEEFQSIHEAYRPLQETLFPGINGGGYNWPSTADERQARLAVMQALAGELGQERVVDLLRASDREFQQMASAVERGGLQLSAARDAYDVRTATCQESVRIGVDQSRSLQDRRAALQTLAETTRQRLVSLLGPQGDSYARSASWLRTIRLGGAVAFDGVTTTTHSLPAAIPPKK